MSRSAFLAARRLIVACLIFALALSGAGRAVMAAQVQPDTPSVVIAGYIVQVCATDGDAEKGTGGDHRQDCDQCPLCAPTLLPQPPVIARPAAILRLAEQDHPSFEAPHIAGPRSPRQSQGPPIA